MDFSGKIFGGTTMVEAPIANAETPVVKAKQPSLALDFTELAEAIKTAPQSLEQSAEKPDSNNEGMIAMPVADSENKPADLPIIPLEGFVTGVQISETPAIITDKADLQTLQKNPLEPLPEPAKDLPANMLEAKPALPQTSVLAGKPATEMTPDPGPSQLPNTDPALKQNPATMTGLPDEKLSGPQIPTLPKESRPSDLPFSKPEITAKPVEQLPPLAPAKVQNTVAQIATQGLEALPASLEIGQMASPDLFFAQPEPGRAGALHLASTTAQGDPASLNAAKNISQQIQIQIAKTADPRIEIRLDPPELGRVVVNMVTSDNGVYATISAERPEIIDLMRRNADILAAAFEKAGFGQADLHFESDQNRQFSDGNDEQSDSGQDQTQNQTILETERTYLPGDRLDIRL